MADFPHVVVRNSNPDLIKKIDTALIRYPYDGGRFWWIKRITHEHLTASATSQELDLNTIFSTDPFPTNVDIMPGSFAVLHEVLAGASISAATVTAGPNGGTEDDLLTSTNVFTGASLGRKQTPAAALWNGYFAADLDPRIVVATSSDDVDNATTFELSIAIPFLPSADVVT